MTKTWRIVQHIFEGSETEPTLTHVFYGATRDEAWGVFHAHMQADSFMHGCVKQHRFRDFACNAHSHVEQLYGGKWIVVDQPRR